MTKFIGTVRTVYPSERGARADLQLKKIELEECDSEYTFIWGKLVVSKVKEKEYSAYQTYVRIKY